MPDLPIRPTIESGHPLESDTFPNVSLFTFLPELYLIISRLSVLHESSLGTINNNDRSQDAILAGRTQSSVPQTTSSSNGFLQETQPLASFNALTQTISGGSQTSANSLRPVASMEQTIELKDLPAHLYSVRQDIARSKDVIRRLPDVERTVEQQEEEMTRLRRRIAALDRRLRDLSKISTTTT